MRALEGLYLCGRLAWVEATSDGGRVVVLQGGPDGQDIRSDARFDLANRATGQPTGLAEALARTPVGSWVAVVVEPAVDRAGRAYLRALSLGPDSGSVEAGTPDEGLGLESDPAASDWPTSHA